MAVLQAVLAGCAPSIPTAQPPAATGEVISSASPTPSPSPAPCAGKVQVVNGLFMETTCASAVVIIEPTGDKATSKPSYKISFNGVTWVDYDPKVAGSPLSIEAQFKTSCPSKSEQTCSPNAWGFTVKHNTSVAKLLVVGYGNNKTDPGTATHMGGPTHMGNPYTRWLKHDRIAEWLLIYINYTSK